MAITLSSQKTLRMDVNTTIDGQGLITLDGRGITRLLYFYSPNRRATKTTVTIENLIMENGTSGGTGIASAPAPCSQGTQVDGGGAAIYVRDGVLHVWTTTFKKNQGATLGPDLSRIPRGTAALRWHARPGRVPVRCLTSTTLTGPRQL